MDSTSAYDTLIAHRESEQLLAQTESTIKLKQNKFIPLIEFVDKNKTGFALAKAFPTIFQSEYIEGK